jgi:ubiquinone/menaquinone biosynthesis C-methylase UbiE
LDRKEKTMKPDRQIYDEQAARWNGDGGRAWVEQQAPLDAMFRPFEALLTEAITPGERVLDVGCGTGGTTLAAARATGANGSCVGIDISAPMLEAARGRAGREQARATFVQADAQTYGFEAGEFDAIISRFGVMFFGDPVAAFANLRRAARAGGRLCFAAWRSADENPFMTTTERAAAPFLRNVPARPANGPGQFAFADEKRIHAILEQSGWVDVEVRPINVACSFSRSDLVRFFTRLGPLGVIFRDLDERTREQVIEAVRDAFAPFIDGDDVRYIAACWLVTARVSSSREAAVV